MTFVNSTRNIYGFVTFGKLIAPSSLWISLAHTYACTHTHTHTDRVKATHTSSLFFLVIKTNRPLSVLECSYPPSPFFSRCQQFLFSPDRVKNIKGFFFKPAPDLDLLPLIIGVKIYLLSLYPDKITDHSVSSVICYSPSSVHYGLLWWYIQVARGRLSPV